MDHVYFSTISEPTPFVKIDLVCLVTVKIINNFAYRGNIFLKVIKKNATSRLRVFQRFLKQNVIFENELKTRTDVTHAHWRIESTNPVTLVC